LVQSQKSNAFVDKRIGENNETQMMMNKERQILSRIVKERVRNSKRQSKFNLSDTTGTEDNNEMLQLTHRGKAIDNLTARDHVMLSDDDEDVTGYGDNQKGYLDALDTLQHFGGGTNRGNKRNRENNPYGPAVGDDEEDGNNKNNLLSMYTSRKMELDDFIHRRKVMKAERMQSKEAQVDAFEKMDEAFADLATMLQFRDKEQEIKDYHTAKRQGTLTADDQEFEDWDKEMKQYQFVDRKVKATDRIKTPEEIAQEEAERLHELETRRLARMNGEFDDDDFSDISTTELQDPRRRGRRNRSKGADDLDDLSSDEQDNNENELRTRFTADGLVKIDKDGKVVEKIGEKKRRADDDAPPSEIFAVGTRISASYHAKEQMEGEEVWYDGKISAINRDKLGNITYNVDYDDGDFEDNVEPEHIKIREKTEEEVAKESEKVLESQKRQKAQEKAR
jgi:nucleolar protein 14